jgi:hypothetical protein
MNGNENRIVEMNEGDNDEEEAQYWRDDGLDQVVMQIDTSSQRGEVASSQSLTAKADLLQNSSTSPSC